MGSSLRWDDEGGCASRVGLGGNAGRSFFGLGMNRA